MASDPIAIVGLAGRFPDARDLATFWKNIREGKESLVEFSDADLAAAGIPAALRSHPNWVKRGTVLDEPEWFDALFFGFSPREAQILDPQQRLFLECAWEAMEHAGYAGSAAGQAVGVYAGVGLNTYLLTQLLKNPAFVAAVGGYQLMVGNDKDFLATRVAYKLDFRGPSLTIQTACSTSLVAVEVACRALRHGECDLALAGGCAVNFPQRGGYMFEEGMILSPDGHCRPFDEKAKGTRAGSGAGAVVLKRLADAIADRDTIYGVVLGAAVNNDGAAKAGYTAPSVEGQVEVIATAQALSGVDPRTIGYVEAHGTGTPLGDPIEIAALTQAFRAHTKDIGFCRIGSLKANIGHLDAAAGVAGLIKALLVLNHREIPPLVNFEKPNPELDLERSPFVASASASPWPAEPGVPRRAAISSFGIGGTNAHLVLEEAPPITAQPSKRTAHLLVLSARSDAALDRATANLGAYFNARGGAPETAPVGDVAWTLAVGRQAFARRRAVVVRDAAHAAKLFAEPQSPAFLQGAYEGAPRPVAFLFSGQGSQHAGMGASLYRTERVFREAFDRCADVLTTRLGLDLRKVVFEAGDGGGSDRAINETRLTQPALFATEYALAKLWLARGVTPAAMVGHSIGEYVAAHLAGVFSLDDALTIVAERGRLMQALPAGSMAAVHLDAGELERLLPPGVEIAAKNAPGLCTVSGTAEGVSKLLADLATKGVESRALHTSHAFHSAMMEPALAPFTALLAQVKLSAPSIPYASNLTGTWIKPEEATSPAYYAKHLRHAVEFEAGIRTVSSDPSTLLLEVGPGTALTTLARLTLGRDGARRVFSSLAHPRDKRPDAEAALDAAARLWLAGAELAWKGLHDDDAPRRVPLPTYPFERARHWVEAVETASASGAAAPATTGVGLVPSPRVEDWVHAPTWMRDDSDVRRDAREATLSGTWLVLTPGGPLGEAVARRLHAAGSASVIVEPGDKFERLESRHFKARPGVEDDLSAVARQLETPVAGVVHLWALAPAASFAQRYDSIVTLAALASDRADRPTRIVVATSGVESVLAEPVRDHDGAVTLGPVLALPVEVAGITTRAVDLGIVDIDVAAEELVAEAALVDDERFVARRAGRRWVRRYERAAVPPGSAPPLEPKGVYLITGGLGGIGLVLARWLAEKTSARLVLTARRALPAREEWDAWLAAHPADDRAASAIRAVREIEAAGGEVLVAAADAADEAAMRRAVDAARARWGKIDGVIHAAGVAGTGTVAVRKTAEEIRACLAPKVDGLAVLVRILGDTPLAFVALQSTINTVIGWAGASDYAAANAVLDAFVDSEARPKGWRNVVSFGWGAWRDVGMAAERFAAGNSDVPLELAIPPARGVEIFERVLASGRRRVVVTPFDLSVAIRVLRDRVKAVQAAPPPARPAAAAQDRPQLSTAYVAPSSDTEKKLAEIWSELLGVTPVGVHDDFFELGGHSLLATRVIARIDDTIGVRLTLRNVFEGPTIHKLAQRADEGRPAGPAAEREEVEF